MSPRWPLLLARQHALALLALLSFESGLAAQEVWEFTPYRIQVWLTVGPQAELLAIRSHLGRTLAERADAAVGAPWRLSAGDPPPELSGEISTRFESVSVDEIKSVAPDIFKLNKLDKLYLVNVTADPEDYRIQTRELDCRGRVWGRLFERRVQDISLIGDAAFSAIVEAFAPVARVEGAKEKVGFLRLRAAGLALQDDSPVLVAEPAIFKPYVRSNDKNGDPKPNGITSPPWTMLVVSKREESELTCDIYTGTRVSITGKPNPRVDRFALFVRPPSEVTRLHLRTPDKPPQALSGYDVFAKDPRNEADQELLGRTDWRGTMDIPPAKFPLRLVYVRNGGQLLARLPVVPGVDPLLVVELNSDDKRLQVEGFLKGVQASIMDLIVRQKIFAARIHKRMSESKFDEAQKLLDEFLTLPTPQDLSHQIELQQTRITSPYPRVQDRINKLFNETRKLLNEQVDATLGNKLSKELARAKAGLPPEEDSPAPAPAVPPKAPETPAK